MKAVKNFILFFGFLAFSSTIYSQIAEEAIITESSEPEEIEEVLITPLDDIVEKKIMQERFVLPYDPIREADLFWEKRLWRVLDIREKINKPFAYPNAPFFNLLVEAVQAGDINSYGDDEFKFPLSSEQLDDMLFRVDTTFVTNPDTYEDEMTVVRNEINYEDIKRFRVKEVWFFDEETSTLKVRILGVAPVRDVLDPNTGEFLFEQPMFWIYYPDTREYFARHKVFVPGNDANPLSWEDFFEMRMFSSYIYKESNVDDFRLVDYPSLSGADVFSGVQRLLESEKIKADIFNFEHDLWSY
ncbi:MAG: gliding motility protein GldN [Saprospiraceae bacterium]|nr:gliding motility protein GldN [Saprospiraceae bacterium]